MWFRKFNKYRGPSPDTLCWLQYPVSHGCDGGTALKLQNFSSLGTKTGFANAETCRLRKKGCCLSSKFLLQLKTKHRVLMKRTDVFRADLLFTTSIRYLEGMESDGAAGINIIRNSFSSECRRETASLTKWSYMQNRALGRVFNHIPQSAAWNPPQKLPF